MLISASRKRLRLPEDDYRTPGYYFVTIYLENRRPLFGRLEQETVFLTGAGEMISNTWQSLAERFHSVSLDAYIVMPDHLHGILFFDTLNAEKDMTFLGTVIGAFKSLTTNQYIAGVKEEAWPRFEGRLWQFRFHEHVIRDQKDLESRRVYIERNPSRWAEKRGT